MRVQRIRGDLTKSKSYKKRNWPKHMEKFSENKTQEIAEKIKTNLVEKTNKISKPKSLERVIEKDMLDFSGEEDGFFKIGNEIIKTIFPR